MTKKSSRMMKTLTSGCSQAAERPRPTGRGDPEIFVHVKLSNRELMHSLGISWSGGRRGGGRGEGKRGNKGGENRRERGREKGESNYRELEEK